MCARNAVKCENDSGVPRNDETNFSLRESRRCLIINQKRQVCVCRAEIHSIASDVELLWSGYCAVFAGQLTHSSGWPHVLADRLTRDETQTHTVSHLYSHMYARKTHCPRVSSCWYGTAAFGVPQLAFIETEVRGFFFFGFPTLRQRDGRYFPMAARFLCRCRKIYMQQLKCFGKVGWWEDFSPSSIV